MNIKIFFKISVLICLGFLLGGVEKVAATMSEETAMEDLLSELRNTRNKDWNLYVSTTKQDKDYVERGYGKNTKGRCRPRPVCQPRYTPPPPAPRCGHCGGPHNTDPLWCSHCNQHHKDTPWCGNCRQHHDDSPWCSHCREHHNDTPWCSHHGTHDHATEPWCIKCEKHHTVAQHRRIKISEARTEPDENPPAPPIPTAKYVSNQDLEGL